VTRQGEAVRLMPYNCRIRVADFNHEDRVARAIERKCDMKKQLVRVFAVVALLATGLATQAVRASEDPEDCLYGGFINPSGLVICCDPGGC